MQIVLPTTPDCTVMKLVRLINYFLCKHVGEFASSMYLEKELTDRWFYEVDRYYGVQDSGLINRIRSNECNDNIAGNIGGVVIWDSKDLKGITGNSKNYKFNVMFGVCDVVMNISKRY